MLVVCLQMLLDMLELTLRVVWIWYFPNKEDVFLFSIHQLLQFIWYGRKKTLRIRFTLSEQQWFMWFNSIEVCVETNRNYKNFNIPNDLFSAEFNDIDDSYMEERLLQKIPFGVEIWTQGSLLWAFGHCKVLLLELFQIWIKRHHLSRVWAHVVPDRQAIAALSAELVQAL